MIYGSISAPVSGTGGIGSLPQEPGLHWGMLIEPLTPHQHPRRRRRVPSSSTQLLNATLLLLVSNY